MEIIHERPSQRLHYRVTASMRVAMGEQSFDAVDWGLGGCRISGVFRELPEVGASRKLLCTLPFQGFNITLQAEAEVVRLDAEKGEVAFSFVQLGERETALMQHFVEDLVRGKMTDVADTIVRIDTPVTPVPTKPDPNPTEAMPVRRWPIKQIVMTLFYLVLGAAVFGYVGVYVFATLFRLEVETAVVSAERSTLTAPFAGRVTRLTQRAGDLVTAGSLMAIMENTDREDALRRARAQLASTRAELAERQALVEEEKRRAEGYALVAKNNVRQAESQLEGLELAKENARLKLERVRVLADKGLILADEVETAELSLKSVVSDLARKQIHIQELKQLIDGGDSIRLFTGNAFAGRLAEMEARVARLKTEEDHQQQLVVELAAKETEQGVHAPTDGRLVSLQITEGNAIKQGAPMLVLEETGAEEIKAFLTQEEVLQVRRGSMASLFVPTENRWMSAEVTEIDRTAGFVDEVTETHRFRSPDGRSALVKLRPVAEEMPSSGTPVTVYFERHRNNLVFRTLQQLTGGV
ncbi:HlyD family efflux transporter periplasmic adaptor subunit [Roseibium sp. HPY-6]|uniref:HlyD family secretion protein n=1 Tax=Roseibium sp. HPY-6 TaxID=3229852 RepID=UPI00338FA058